MGGNDGRVRGGGHPFFSANFIYFLYKFLYTEINAKRSL